MAAQTEPSPPFGISGTRVFTLASELVGDDFELHLATSGDSLGADHPVVFLLDSNQDFPLVTAIARGLTDSGLVPPLLIVGIGYPEFPLYHRSRDYTPTADSEAELPSGGASTFLGFLETEVLGWVRRHYPAAGQRVLLGHSLGGLFSLYASSASPDLFDAVVASSPSAWWDDRLIVRQLADTQRRSTRIFTSLGEEETDLMRGAWDELRASLTRSWPAQTFEAVLFDDEHHSTVKPLAFSRGLRWAFSDEGHS